MGLSNVLGLQILSTSPDSGAEFTALLSNALLYPREIKCENSTTLHLFWSSSTDQKDSSSFRPKHIVPAIITSNEGVESLSLLVVVAQNS